MIGLRVLQLAAARASAAGVVLKDLSKGNEPDVTFALQVAERQLRLAFFAVRHELLARRRDPRRAA